VRHPYYRMMFNCETYALENKLIVYPRRHARPLVRHQKDVTQSFGVRAEWDSSRPANVTKFFHKFAKACDDNDISESQAFYILQYFTKKPCSQR